MSQSSEISLPRFSLRVWLSLAAAGAAGLAWLGWKLRRPTREVKVAALYIYPIKGCRGHSLAKAKVTKWGLEDDRIYMIVNEKNVFVSQRELPRMALISPDLPTASGITLRVLGDVTPALNVPIAVQSPKDVKVWDDWVPAVDQGDAAAEWLSTVLQSPKLRLVRITSTAKRATDPKYGTGETAFSDGFPVLVTSTASIKQISRKVAQDGGPQIGIDRFRTNLHIDGCKAFEEDEMKALVLGTVPTSRLRLPLVKPCSRCTVPGVDQQTGQRNKQTGGVLTDILRRIRTAAVLQPKAMLHKGFFSEPKRQQDVYFGQNALCEFKGVESFEITVGDVAVVEGS